MKRLAAVAILMLTLFIALAGTPTILSGESERWYVYEYSVYRFTRWKDEITELNVTITFRVVQVNKTAYRVELLDCEGDKIECESIVSTHEFYTEHKGGIATVFDIPRGDGREYRFLGTFHFSSYLDTILWVSKEALEDAVKGFHVLSGFVEELNCEQYVSVRERVYECAERCVEERCKFLPRDSKDWNKCYAGCIWQCEGEVSLTILLTILFHILLSPKEYGHILDTVCARYETNVVRFEKFEAQRLPNAYVYEAAYTVVDKDERERVKVMYSASGWLLEGVVEYHGWDVHLDEKMEIVKRGFIRLLDTNDITVKASSQTTERTEPSGVGGATQQPEPAQPPQLGDAKYLVAVAVILVFVVIATVLTRKAK